MPRDISDAYTRNVLAPERTAYPVVFMELTHPQIKGGIQVVSDFTRLDPATKKPVPYSYAGKTWIAFPFEMPLLNDTSEIPESKIRIQNVDRRIGKALLAISDAIEIAITVISSADFAVNAGHTAMEPVGTPTVLYFSPLAYLRNVRWDRSDITGAVQPFDPSREPVPAIKADPLTAPGLWM
jgi:hypothetical protein